MLVSGGLAAVGSLGAVGASLAADLANRPLAILAPANPGGAWDQFSRVMQYTLRQENIVAVPVEVRNRGGAGGTIALAEFVSRERGNPSIIMVSGNTLLASSIAHNSPTTIRSTIPLAKMVSDYLVVAVRADSPLHTFDQLLQAFAAAPGEFSWCGGSAGSSDHMMIGRIAEVAGVSPRALRYVAYSGGGEASAALLGGQVSAGVNGWSEWKALRDEGRVRFLAISSEARTMDRTTPTFREQGYDLTFENWRALFLPPGLSDEQVNWWMSLTERMRASATWRDSVKKYGWEDSFVVGAELQRFLASEQRDMAIVLARLGIGSGGSGYAAIGPWAFPTAIGVAATLSAAGVALELRKQAQPAEAALASEEGAANAVGAAQAFGPAAPTDVANTSPSWKRFAVGLGMALAYFVAMQFVGFLIATPVFVLGVCWLIGSKALIRDGAVGAILTLLTWLLFTRLLQIALP